MKLNIKTLLLGSVAATFVAAGAQAADLTVAEPVDYVKVCDLFGAGYFYSPGTDTCIKVGGYVKFGTAFGGTQFGTYNTYYPNSNWNNFYTDTEIQVTASSVTEYGNLTGYVGLEATTSSTGSFTQSASQFINSETNSAYIDQAYLQLGALKAGRFTSLYDFGRGYTDTGFFGSDTTSDHIQATYAINGFGLALSIEDQRDRGAAPGLDTYDPSSGVYAYGGQTNIPDIVGAVTYASGIFSSKIAAAYVNDAVDRSGSGTVLDPYNYQAQTGWAIGGSVELALDQVSAGDKFFFTASYGDNANAYTGIAGGTSVAALSSYTSNALAAAASGTSWSTGASYKHVWMPQLYTALSAGYAEWTGNGEWHGDDGLKAFRVVLGTDWTPVKNLDLLLEGAYNKVNGEGAISTGDAWTTVMWIKRSFP